MPWPHNVAHTFVHSYFIQTWHLLCTCILALKCNKAVMPHLWSLKIVLGRQQICKSTHIRPASIFFNLLVDTVYPYFNSYMKMWYFCLFSVYFCIYRFIFVSGDGSVQDQLCLCSCWAKTFEFPNVNSGFYVVWFISICQIQCVASSAVFKYTYQHMDTLKFTTSCLRS